MNADRKPAAPERPHHVVVAGYSRSGTTLFYNMLRGSVRDYEFLDREVPAARVVGADDRNRITKRPLDLFRLDEIVAANTFGKRLSLVVLVRDVRSIVTSFHRSVPDDYFIGYDHQYFVDRSAGQVSYTNPGVMQIAQAVHRALADTRFDDRLVLRYEDLVADPTGQQERLGRELGFRYGGDFASFHEHEIPEGLARALNTVRPLDRSRLDGWRRPEHAQRIRSQFTRCPQLFDLLVLYGYEKDRAWFDAFRRSS